MIWRLRYTWQLWGELTVTMTLTHDHCDSVILTQSLWHYYCDATMASRLLWHCVSPQPELRRMTCLLLSVVTCQPANGWWQTGPTWRWRTTLDAHRLISLPITIMKRWSPSSEPVSTTVKSMALRAARSVYCEMGKALAWVLSLFVAAKNAISNSKSDL